MLQADEGSGKSVSKQTLQNTQNQIVIYKIPYRKTSNIDIHIRNEYISRSNPILKGVTKTDVVGNTLHIPMSLGKSLFRCKD